MSRMAYTINHLGKGNRSWAQRCLFILQFNTEQIKQLITTLLTQQFNTY
jgi:hypothetical protein